MDTPEVIFQDDYILALNKPSGMDVEMLQTFVKDNFKFDISNSRELRNGLVHRLDKPTSGVILFAKTAQVFSDLQKQEHTSELQSHSDLVCRLLLEKKKNIQNLH